MSRLFFLQESVARVLCRGEDAVGGRAAETVAAGDRRFRREDREHILRNAYTAYMAYMAYIAYISNMTYMAYKAYLACIAYMTYMSYMA